LINDVGFVSHLLACIGYGALAGVLLSRRDQNAASLWMVAACIITAVWAAAVVLAARYGDAYVAAISPLETLRSAAWIAFLAALLMPSWRLDKQVSSSFVIAVALGVAVAGQLVMELVDDLEISGESLSSEPLFAYLFVMSRLAAATGGVVLVHNLYVNAAPSARWSIQLLCIGLVGLFGYDLNMYTLNLLSDQLDADLFNVRGAVDALLVPVIALSVQRNRQWRLQLSRKAAFHTFSLTAVGGYLVLMSLAAYGLKLAGGDWGTFFQISFLFGAIVLAAVVLFSGRFRASARVWINKHFFAYKYDYREEWLRVIATVSRTGAGYGDLSERVVQAVCSIVDSPGGALYARADDGAFEPAGRWNFRAAPTAPVEANGDLARFLEGRGRIVDLDELRAGKGDYGGLALPAFAVGDPRGWLIVPLLHLERLAGFVVIERSLAKRELNWEDFDLLRTVGRQAASYIAEASSQAALLEAMKFDEFNRRFAFIMHDIKNLVSQLGLVARNAERHADNPEFRADMVATLQNATAKMNDMLARLAQHNTAKADDAKPVDLCRVVAEVVGAKRNSRPAPKLLPGPVGLHVLADEQRLEQVFAHLIQNAIDASTENGVVAVAVAHAEGEALVEVRDEGCGMSAAFVRSELFKPFHSTKVGGFGIGAYEAREIVRGMGGRLDVTSREGEGTVFTVALPLAGDVRERKRA